MTARERDRERERERERESRRDRETGGGVGREGGWSSKKKVCLGTLLDPGGGGLPNPTESTMWGKGSWGARPLGSL